jgi:uroporphyrinogen decarboxylase
MRPSNATFLDACNGRETDFTPVWFMRQAGRYLPSYMRIKGDRTVIDLAKDPERASEAAVDAVRALGVDAAIVFADIMLPLESVGVDFRIQENVGPVVARPVGGEEDVESIGHLDASGEMPFLADGVSLTLEKLGGTVPLIGFSGAPFTLAAYLVEGGPSRDLEKTKAMMYSRPELWKSLMEKLTGLVCAYLDAQVRAGVDAVQLFDSWVGCLAPEDYRRFVLPYTREVLSSIGGVPKIHFCADSASLIEAFHETGADVLSVDWRLSISDVWERCSEKTAVQGNLDPAAAVAGGKEMERRVSSILRSAEGHRGHIFSLGHGVARQTSPENLRTIVQLVHSDAGRGRR